MIDLQIKENIDCMGCYGCYNICPEDCISMDTDSEGFWYPKVNYNKCIECGLCVNVCPIINNKKVKNNSKAYACNNNDEFIRFKSSSGGIFTLVAEKIIDNGGIVFGVGFDKDFSVVHSYIEKKENISIFRGSKYVQSKVGNTYRQVKKFLGEGRPVLFTGTPCQVSGLKSYLGKEYNNLFCMDNICHGVPSPKVWDKYVSYRSMKADSKPGRIAFRLKNEGWKLFSVSFSFENDTEYKETQKKDLYMRAFLKDVCLRPSCYDCKFKGINRESDITLADFWGIQNVMPEMDDDKGTSLILVNSVNARKMFDNIKDEISYQEVDINTAVSYNSAAIKSVDYNPNREGFLKELDSLEFDQLVKKYCRDKFGVRIKRKIKSIGIIILNKTGTKELVKTILGKNKIH